MSKIYIGTYSKYNNGNLFGSWLDLDDYACKDDFLEACFELHKDESDPELMYQDKEDLLDDLCSESFIHSLAFEYSLLDDEDKFKFEAWLDINKLDPNDDSISSLIKDISVYPSKIEYAERLFEDCYSHDMPELLVRYFDMESWTRDLFMDTLYYEDNNGQIAIFNN